MPDSDSSVELLLEGLKNNFLAEIPERCDSQEESILALESKDSFASAFDELFRAIHSLKGSGGTLGLSIITSISHQFEDLLSEIDGKKDRLTNDLIDVMLKYNDLLRSTAKQIASENLSEERVYRELESLKIASTPYEYTCMIVDPSNMLARSVVKEFSSLPVKVTIINDGLLALERLLKESFDILITSKELPVLNGVALITALRNSDSKNAKVPCIVTTSKAESLPLAYLNEILIIRKDKLMTKNLANAVETIIANLR